MIKTLGAQIKQLERQIATAIREHPDGEIFLSLFKGSVITAAELLAEIGDCRGRYPTRDALAGDAGQAAVAIESGKRKTACFRWGCNKRLRHAFYTLADSSRHWQPLGADLYAHAIARGHDHPRALRTLGRAWCRVVWQLLARPHPLRPRPPPRPATAHHCHDPYSVGPRARPSRHPADGRRRRHPKGGPQGRARQRLTASRHPLSQLERLMS